MDRCSSCVLPVTSQGISFDRHGVCSVCRVAASQSRRGPSKTEEALSARIEAVRARGAGRRFDCLVGLSGGRDSTYLLYLLVRKHGLRCLAAYYRTPFTPSVIDANVRRLVQNLGVPLEEIDVSQEHHRKIAREIVSLWAVSPDPILANLACAPCKRVNSELLAIARRHRVRTLVLGSNRFEIVQVAAGSRRNMAPTTASDALSEGRFFRQVIKNFVILGRGLQTLFRHRALWRYLPLGIHASILALAPNTPYLRLRHPRIEVVEYFNHAEWNERDLERALAEVGWELPPGCRSTWRADCTFADLKNLMFRSSMGLSYVDALLSNMVRAGAVSRDEALARLRAGADDAPERVAETIAILQLPIDVADRLAPNARRAVAQERAAPDRSRPTGEPSRRATAV